MNIDKMIPLNYLIILVFDVILVLQSFIIVIILCKHFGISNKENILQMEKYTIVFFFFIFSALRSISQILITDQDQDQKRIINNSLYGLVFDFYIKQYFMFNFLISLLIYKNVKDPTHLLRSIITRPFHIEYELCIFLVIIIAGPFNYYKHINTNDHKLYKILAIINMIPGQIINIVSLFLMWKAHHTLKSFNFSSKKKLISYIRGNLMVSILYILFSVFRFYIFFNNNERNTAFLITFRSVFEFVTFCDILTVKYQMFCSDCYTTIIQNTKWRHFFFLYNCCYRKFHNDDNINQEINNIDNPSQLLGPKMTLIEDFLQKNNYRINSYYIEILDNIINISIASIVLEINKKIKNPKQQANRFLFTKDRSKNDFENDDIVNSLIETVPLSERSKIRATLQHYYHKEVFDIFSCKGIKLSKIKDSLLSNYNSETRGFISVLTKNIKEEKFHKFKYLTLKTIDKQINIEIYPYWLDKQLPTKNFLQLLIDYFNLLKKKETFLPLLLGIYKVEINKFAPIFIILTNNSLNENTVKNNLDYSYQLVKIDYPFNSKENFENEKNSLLKRGRPLQMKSFNNFRKVLQEDIEFIHEHDIKYFSLNILYYQGTHMNEEVQYSITDENCNSLSEEMYSFYEGFQVKEMQRFYTFHFQFGRIFDVENFGWKCSCSCCNCGSVEKKFLDMIANFFKSENELVEVPRSNSINISN